MKEVVVVIAIMLTGWLAGNAIIFSIRHAETADFRSRLDRNVGLR